MLEAYPALQRIIRELDKFLASTHPEFFGPEPIHPFSPLKPYKVIHDHLWGTSRFTWRELGLIDTPILQRLRGIHQTGLAYYVYPSARHSRFEHSLGVLTVASKVFDSLQQRFPHEIRKIAAEVIASSEPDTITAVIDQWRQELRLAALLHDTGHSLHSHASEQVYSNIELLKDAGAELTRFVGKDKGAGEVISFCLARTDALRIYLERAQRLVITSRSAEEIGSTISLSNVSLLIVGRSHHPLLQFLGDLISSGFDADKLDYLLRDASAAGLPLKYDLERYLYTVYLDRDALADDEHELETLYASIGATVTRKQADNHVSAFEHYDTYRLRLPKLAMSTIEQIIICKLMLFSYIYHHPKVRAAEGILVRLLRYKTDNWSNNGESDDALLCRFMSMSDSALDGQDFLGSSDPIVREYSYRIQNRILPRQVYRLSAAATGDEDGAILKNFFTQVEDKAQRAARIASLEEAIGLELLKGDPALGTNSRDALFKAGVWVDVPKVPRFEDINVIIGKEPSSPGVKIRDVFPIGQWTEAYEAHRFYIRIFAFSEYVDLTKLAARSAIEAQLGIKTDSVFETASKQRSE
jgi:uncharacterized protein